MHHPHANRRCHRLPNGRNSSRRRYNPPHHLQHHRRDSGLLHSQHPNPHHQFLHPSFLSYQLRDLLRHVETIQGNFQGIIH